jgi:hypothetical protein
MSAMSAHPLDTDVDPGPTPRRRRWLQFSLRSAMVFITVVCCVIAWLIYRAEQQRRTAARIRALQEYADACQERYEKIQALYVVNAKGGEADNFAASERDLWKARAEIALIQGDKLLAIANLQKALKAAELCRAARTNHLAGYFKMDNFLADVHEASAAICEIKLKLAELSPEALDGAK